MATPGTPATIRDAVRERFSAVAREPSGKYNFRVGRDFAEALGYPVDLLDELPQSASEPFTGVATASLLAQPAAGETVVDLGSGGGLDLSVLACKVGRDGRVVGVDLAPDMVARARATLEQLGVQQAEVLEADPEDTGLPDTLPDTLTSMNEWFR
jgi:arsenite methyltransferase